MNTTQNEKPPLVISFSGPVQHQATKLLRNWICAVAAGQYSSVTLLFSSWGGSLTDGFSLYNLIRALPVPVTMVNVGSVESVAVAVFLAGGHRIACPGTRFLLHDFTWTFGDKEALTPNLIEERSSGLEFYKKLYRQLLVERCQNITDARLDELKLFDKPIILDAAAAQQAGLVEQVSQYAIPAGCKVVNMDY